MYPRTMVITYFFDGFLFVCALIATVGHGMGSSTDHSDLPQRRVLVYINLSHFCTQAVQRKSSGAVADSRMKPL
ncbi:hypothetical protein C8Q74DRAFT_584914 [Fomes fomentarius]|nr:hypothetical protein C8Q74DRAFT_584914 [Fomes fomentarius]